jgi:hypothetical protein
MCALTQLRWSRTDYLCIFSSTASRPSTGCRGYDPRNRSAESILEIICDARKDRRLNVAKKDCTLIEAIHSLF